MGRAEGRGANTVELLIVMGVVALAVSLPFTVFGGELAKKLRCLGGKVTLLASAGGACGANGAAASRIDAGRSTSARAAEGAGITRGGGCSFEITGRELLDGGEFLDESNLACVAGGTGEGEGILERLAGGGRSFDAGGEAGFVNGESDPVVGSAAETGELVRVCGSGRGFVQSTEVEVDIAQVKRDERGHGPILSALGVGLGAEVGLGGLTVLE